MKFRVIISYLLSLVTAVAMAASPSDVFTIQKAVQTAFEKNPDIQNFRDRILEGESASSYAWSQIFPNVSAQLSANENKAAVNNGSAIFGGETYNQYSGQIKFVQPLFAGGALTSAIHAAKKETQVRELDLEINKRELTMGVLHAFYSILLSEKLLSIYKDAEQVQKDSLATSRRYYEAGRSPIIDVYQNETQLALITPKIVLTENQVKASGYLLATLLHSTDMSQIQIKGKLSVLDRERINRILDEKKTERMELSKNNLQLEQFRFNKTVQFASNLPNLSFLGNIGRTTNAKNELLSANSTQWSVALQLTIPLFSGFSSVGQRNILAAQEAQLKDKQTKLKDQLSLEEIQSITNLNNAEIMLLATQKAADFSTKSQNQAKKDYRQRTISNLQFQLVQQSYLDAQSSFVTAKFNYLLALEQYFVALGVPLSVLVDLLEETT